MNIKINGAELSLVRLSLEVYGNDLESALFGDQEMLAELRQAMERKLESIDSLLERIDAAMASSSQDITFEVRAE